MEKASPDQNSIINFARNLKRKYIGFSGGISSFEKIGFSPDEDEISGDFERIFWKKTGSPLYKWHHYFDIYERHFNEFRNKPIKFLEIGVAKGGSLEAWREYFGPEATIFGIDILPECIKFDGVAGQVRIGSQDDPDFLREVVKEMGGLDLVLDDGSHDSHHIRKTFQTLFPILAQGGVYMIEDLHAAYWSSFSGGYKKNSSFLEDVKQIIDDMHHWYHPHGVKITEAKNSVKSMSIYDSIVVFEKAPISKPSFSWTGDVP